MLVFYVPCKLTTYKNEELIIKEIICITNSKSYILDQYYDQMCEQKQYHLICVWKHEYYYLAHLTQFICPINEN